MHFMSAKETADKWNVSQRRIVLLCKENRIPGAMMVGHKWIIPADIERPDDAHSAIYLPNSTLYIKTFLKWAGGKAQILSEIQSKYPQGLGSSITKYAEPFVGGGAVLFDILNKYELDEIYISDINSELILTYKNIRDHIDELILALHTLQDEYFALDICKRNSYYYDKRERFNLLKKIKSESVELAALFIFLNRTCFNGLYRVNSKGEFNVPMGSYKNPTICEEANVRAVSEKLQMVNIVCGDYKKSRQFIDSRTFAYFDPPYRPLSSTSSFTSYAQGGFDDKQQAELAQFIDEVSEKGAAVVASNSDPKNTDENDDFFDRLYAKHNIHRISAMRMINSVGEGRGKISELLITTY
ncbi:MAG: Dam family site-specific DNA-(adenine-N6)-methyltransferase [Dethiobacter sp.]|nr:Dam family site-specific DNA-(adenine-N6)-methyltransferase [Dethiobacter sp.]MBS3983380.1 Dam family site-specific DNA-(adenine-N6)-methyltransferase [Dethiobacter sp.]MCL4462674.1 Dam family site-specific DNA-(adenine-N6)-methyltransferase [Bacillota bacterium]MCL5994126.1 Dam family site-specific DNA-(adenine-N6)-methyltransferase [Bacillota bacterium]